MVVGRECDDWYLPKPPRSLFGTRTKKQCHLLVVRHYLFRKILLVVVLDVVVFGDPVVKSPPGRDSVAPRLPCTYHNGTTGLQSSSLTCHRPFPQRVARHGGESPAWSTDATHGYVPRVSSHPAAEPHPSPSHLTPRPNNKDPSTVPQ